MSAPLSVRARAAAAFREHVGEPVSIEAMKSGRHHLFRVRGDEGVDYVVKIYRPTVTLFKDIEIVAYGRLRGWPSVRACFGAAQLPDGTPSYIITEYVEGETLLDRVVAGDLDDVAARSAIEQVVGFVRSCMSVAVRGFGELDDELVGDHAAWTGFLDGYIGRLQTAVAALPSTAARSSLIQGLEAAARFRAERDHYLRRRPAAFVPIDMNQANFLVARDGRVVALDLKSFLAGDPLFAVAEWMSHTHGTSRYDAFIEHWGRLDREEEACVRYYALICNVDVLLYVASNAGGDPDEACPWGNPRRFVDLIAEHATWLSRSGGRDAAAMGATPFGIAAA
jgi:hypothetical protein